MKSIRFNPTQRRNPPGVQTHFSQAKLIWHPEQSAYFDPVVNAFCFFRKTFSLKNPAREGKVRIFADSRYMLYLNGQYLGRGPCRSDPTWQYVDLYEIGDLLKVGKNTLSALVLYYGYGTGHSISMYHGLYVDCEIEDSAGDHLAIFSDDTWKCRFADCYDSTAPRINGCQGPIEIFDARKATQWWSPELDDTPWPNAMTLHFNPYWHIVDRDIPLMEETALELDGQITRRGLVGPSDTSPPNQPIHEQMLDETSRVRLDPLDQPMAIEGYQVPPAGPDQANVLLVDIGRIESGYLRLDLEGAAGTIVDVVYAEQTGDQGNFILSWRNRPMDRFILKEGLNRFEITFGWKTFRFLQLYIRDSKSTVVLRSLGLLRRWYPIEKVGTFETDDDQLMRIGEISRHTLRICMQDGFMDSSSREQQQWMGDGRWQAVMNYYLSGDPRLHRKLLDQFGQSQNWMGLLRARYPDGHPKFPTITTYGLAWLSSFWDYYLYSGDDGLFERWWPNLIHLLRWFHAYENDKGLLEDLPFWAFIDWGGLSYDPSINMGIITPVNLMYLEALKVARRIAVHLGDEEADLFYGEKSAALAETIHDELWDTDRKAYCDIFKEGAFGPTLSEATNTLALLHLHDASDERTNQIYDAIFSPNRHDGVLIGSPYLFTLVCRALADIGHAERALELIRERYGKMLAAGATTTWEEWELFQRDEKGVVTGICSASHAWAANPILFFGESIAGIRPLMPGFAQFSIRPQLCGLGGFKATVPTPTGPIEMEAKSHGSSTKIKIQVPKGTQGVHPQGELLPPGLHEIKIQF